MNKNKIVAVVSLLLMCLLAATAAWGGGSKDKEEPESTTTTTTTTTMEATGKYQEAPELAALVAKGELPPVEERLPEQPFVLQPLESVGTYGGTFTVFALDNFPWNELTEEPSRGSVPLRMTMDGEILPDIAIGYEQPADSKTFTLKLRKGMKWSDGSPFTSADFTFHVNDMVNHPDVETWGLGHWGEFTVSAPDDYTVVYTYEKPTPRVLLDVLHWRGSEWMIFHPKDFLKKWHIDYNENAEALAKEEGYDSWFEALNFHANFVPLNDIEKPTISPWRPKNFSTTVRVYERNPYHHQVDTAGQQLPYVGEIISNIVDRETYNLKVVAGEADLAWMFTTLDNYTLFKESESDANYVVKPIPGVSGTDASYGFNQNHEDPIRRALYQNRKFRQALSIAIDREEINDLVFNGLGVPRQDVVLPNASYYKPEWENAWALYDPDRANQMLDELGLDKRSSSGIRLQSDGKPMVINVEFPDWFRAVAVHELVKEYWREVGIDMRPKAIQSTLLWDKMDTTNWDAWSSKSDRPEMYSYLGGFAVPPGAPLWSAWMNAQNAIDAGTATLDDYEGGKLPGEEPPDYIKEYLSWGPKKQTLVYGSPQYREFMSTVFQTMADEVYLIGTVGMTPVLFISRPNIANIPDEMPPWFEESMNFNYYAAQWYFK